MFRRLSLLVLPAVALLLLADSAMAAPRYKRLAHPVLPAAKIPAEVLKIIKHEFPTGKITGSWLEEKGEMEVFVVVPGAPVIEVVFSKKGSGAWHLTGYEYPVPTASLTPKAMTALHAKYPKAKILEVEMFFSPSWTFLGYQVTLQNGGAPIEVFILPSGKFGTDPW